MKAIKKIILISVVLGGLFFLFGPEVAPENLQPQEILSLAKDSDVIIVFNSGGWGYTPLEKAWDFAPIIEGIQGTLSEWGYSSAVIPYNRTKNTLIGKVAGAKDFLNSFNLSSKTLAEEIEFLAKNSPDKKIIIAGLSNGAAFVNRTYEKVSEEVKGSVYAISLGDPFWTKTFKSDNMLQLDNNGKDSLAEGEIKTLIFSLIETPSKWLSAKINGQNLTFFHAIQPPGHEYLWNSSDVGPQIVTFLQDKLR